MITRTQIRDLSDVDLETLFQDVCDERVSRQLERPPSLVEELRAKVRHVQQLVNQLDESE